MNKKIVFAIQGEGRGHLTQALAAFEILTRRGYTVSGLIIGKTATRQMPESFTKKFNIPILTVDTFHFSINKNQQSVSFSKTILYNIFLIKKFRKSLAEINSFLKEHQPDLVINFYEPLMALYTMLYRCPFKLISIAHQNIYLHPGFRFPDGNTLQAMALKTYTWLTARGASIQLAISMYNMPGTSNRKLIVCPPLLRKQVLHIKPSEGDFILVYLLNSSYAKDIVRLHHNNPELKLVCFTDSKEVVDQHAGELRLHENMVFHALNEIKFLDLMSRCRALVCTAGFESVCEAMYLDKPVMMVPVKGHYEQYCNARDASRIGAGIFSEEFDVSKLENCFIFYDKEKNRIYREWVNSFETQFLRAIESITHQTISRGRRDHIPPHLSHSPHLT